MADTQCRAVSQPGTPLTIYANGQQATITLGPGDSRYQICTQRPDHRGGHSACDGHGHILATWPRRKPEKYWHPQDCADCAHHRTAASQWN
jgi:hypothetical protein